MYFVFIGIRRDFVFEYNFLFSLIVGGNKLKASKLYKILAHIINRIENKLRKLITKK